MEEQRRRTAAAETTRAQRPPSPCTTAGNRAAPDVSVSTAAVESPAATQETRAGARTCTHCGGTGHLHTKCYILHPEQARKDSASPPGGREDCVMIVDQRTKNEQHPKLPRIRPIRARTEIEGGQTPHFHSMQRLFSARTPEHPHNNITAAMANP